METSLIPSARSAGVPLPLTLLLSHSDAAALESLTAQATEAVDGLTVLAAPDGADAIRLGLHHAPALTVIDLAVPMGGLGAAVTLRELRRQMPLAVLGSDLPAHRAGARRLGVPLFSSAATDSVLEWITLECAVARGKLRPIRHDPWRPFSRALMPGRITAA
jgi:CheY-like chemotaxis protein